MKEMPVRHSHTYCNTTSQRSPGGRFGSQKGRMKGVRVLQPRNFTPVNWERKCRRKFAGVKSFGVEGMGVKFPITRTKGIVHSKFTMLRVGVN